MCLTRLADRPTVAATGSKSSTAEATAIFANNTQLNEVQDINIPLTISQTSCLGLFHLDDVHASAKRLNFVTYCPASFSLGVRSRIASRDRRRARQDSAELGHAPAIPRRYPRPDEAGQYVTKLERFADACGEIEEDRPGEGGLSVYLHCHG